MSFLPEHPLYSGRWAGDRTGAAEAEDMRAADRFSEREGLQMRLVGSEGNR